jgi:hypothetical protein
MLSLVQKPRKPMTAARQASRVARLESKLATLLSQLTKERELLDQLTKADPIVGYQCAHYLTHQTFVNENWIGLYLTPHKWQAQSAACSDSGKSGFPATTSDLVCVAVHQSELEDIKPKHTNIQDFRVSG